MFTLRSEFIPLHAFFFGCFSHWNLDYRGRCLSFWHDALKVCLIIGHFPDVRELLHVLCCIIFQPSFDRDEISADVTVGLRLVAERSHGNEGAAEFESRSGPDELFMKIS